MRNAPPRDFNQIFGMPERYEYEYFEEMVDGGGGFKLLTRIYLPKGDGPHPVIVTRTPYASAERGDNNVTGREYAKRGIGYIQQDCRGRGGSEGFYTPNVDEREDGIALYKWLDAQAWCGSIGVFGSSYTALTGWIVADQVPDRVKGFYLSHYGVDRFISLYHSGLFRQDIVSGWIIGNAAEPIRRPERMEGQPPGEQNYPFFLHRPHVEADVAILEHILPYYRDWVTNTNYNDPYWNTGVWGDLKSIPPKVNVPVTIVAGQFDHHQEGTILGYERLNPAVMGNSRLILGSWNHSFQPTPTHHPTVNAMEFSTTADQFRWFYSLLVNNVVPQGEIRVYAVGSDRWVNLDRWPMEAQQHKTFYLSNTRTGNNSKAYRLTDANQRTDAVISYKYDPLNPVFAIGGETNFTSSQRTGSRLQPEPGFRDDVISFVSEPLTENITIAGNIIVKLVANTDVDDTCFAITLSEVGADGNTYNMRTAITTMAYRNAPLENRQTYTPGEKVELTIEATPILWTVKAGSSLRVDVKSSNFPEYSVHSNYAGVWAEQAQTRVANQNIFVGGNNASRLIIPLINLTDVENVSF